MGRAESPISPSWVVQQFTIPLPQRKRLDENEKDSNRGPRERKKGENSGSSNGLTRGRREKSRRKETASNNNATQ